MLIAVLGTLTIGLDTAVNIALPAISAAFDVPATSIQWIVLTYIVTFAVALIPAGRLADRAGHARVFRAGLALTGVAHALCGLALAWLWLLGARIVQGLGAALVMASAPALVTLSTDPGARGQALGRLGLAASLGAAIGPLGGGVLVGLVGWRLVYLGRLPLVALTLGLSCRVPGVEALAPVRGGRLAVGPRTAPRSGPGRAALADPRMFVAANGAHLLANAALFAIWLLVPYYLIDRRRFSAGVGGLLFTTCPLAQVCVMPLGGYLADRGVDRWLAPLALGMEAVGLWLTGRLGAAATPVDIVLALGLAGVGSGLFVVANMHYVMGALPRTHQGVAGSLISLMRTAGIVVGANVTTAVYAAGLSAPTSLGSDDAVARAFAGAFGVATAIAGVAALLSLVPPRARRATADPSAP